MKKFLLTAMIASMLILPAEGVLLSDPAVPEADVSQAMEFVPGTVPAGLDAVESMTPAIHAVVLSMVNQGQTFFNGGADLNWEIFYNMFSLYGQLDVRVSQENGYLVLPVESIMDFVTALGPSLDDLGPLPEELSDRMTYDPETDSYLVACGGNDLASLQLISCDTLADGTLDVTGSMVYQVDGSDLLQFRVKLQPQENMFGYTIDSLELL